MFDLHIIAYRKFLDEQASLRSGERDFHVHAYRSIMSEKKLRAQAEYAEAVWVRVQFLWPKLAQALLVADAINKLHHRIRNSAASNFWPHIRGVKCNLFFRPQDRSQPLLPGWTKSRNGNHHHKMPGLEIFSPAFCRIDRHFMQSIRTVGRFSLEYMNQSDEDGWSKYYFSTRAAEWIDFGVGYLKCFQQFVGEENSKILDQWSSQPDRGTTMTLRIRDRKIIFADGSIGCEIPIPSAVWWPLEFPGYPQHPPLVKSPRWTP